MEIHEFNINFRTNIHIKRKLKEIKKRKEKKEIKRKETTATESQIYKLHT